ncbi:MAG: glycosyltransferase family 4 protein [Verrucomicrobiota bacterium]
MKIAIVCQNRRVVGGIETYLRRVLPELRARGHELAVWYEHEGDATRAPVAEEATAPCQQLDVSALLRLQEWQPELIYAHGLSEPSLEEPLPGVAPVVFFAHGYGGVCISGTKCHKFPDHLACERVFGPACLALYYPRRCGGWNPLTMLREYAKNARRLAFLKHCRFITVASQHMAAEYRRHGLGDKVTVASLPVTPDVPVADSPALPSDTWQLLFLGRAQDIKGGAFLLQALSLVAAAKLSRPVHTTIAGDGEALGEWRAAAAQLVASTTNVSVQFAGWVDGEAKARLLARTHLLVLPSLWPEPFGMTGVEAGHHGVPCAAFASGGVREWLEDGVNGHLASANPPQPSGLAKSIVECLKDTAHYQRLRQGASERAQRFSMARHIEALENVFREAVKRP